MPRLRDFFFSLLTKEVRCSLAGGIRAPRVAIARSRSRERAAAEEMAATRGGAPEWRFFQVFGEEQPDGAGVEDIQEGQPLYRLHSTASRTKDQPLPPRRARH